MKILRNSLISLVVVAAIIIGFWQYHRHMVASFARVSLAQAFHISENQVDTESVQELGFWRDKLNPLRYQVWSVDFTVPGGPKPSSGVAYTCTIDEPSFGHFKHLRIPISLPRLPLKH